jgi:hypothetical protein
MAQIRITPAPSKLAQLRGELNGRFGRYVYKHTLAADGSITLHGTMMGVLYDVVRHLNRDGLITM